MSSDAPETKTKLDKMQFSKTVKLLAFRVAPKACGEFVKEFRRSP
jgi:hypothetical protein